MASINTTKGCIAGSIPSGTITSRLGRRVAIILLSGIFTIGALIQIAALNIQMLYVGRFVCGFAVGALSMAGEWGGRSRYGSIDEMREVMASCDCAL